MKSKDKIIEFLWKLLDDIDTASDWAKSNDIAYRKAVEKIRFITRTEFLSSI